MKNFKVPLFLVWFLFMGLGHVAASTFTVNQNLINITPSTSCINPVSVHCDGTTVDNIVSLQVDVDHNIAHSGSPTLPGTVNNQCWRIIKFHIYKVVNGVPQTSPEATLTKYQHWLTGAATNNGSSSNQYHLTESDIRNANLSVGQKEVRISVKYHYWGNSPHTINLFVSNSGVPSWNYLGIDDGSPGVLTCNLPGVAGCFNFVKCPKPPKPGPYPQESETKKQDLSPTSFDFSFGPNPASVYTSLNVNFVLPGADAVNLDLFDLSGRKVRNLASEIIGSRGDNSMKIRLSGLTSGTYFVRFTSEKNGVLTKKIVILE